VHRFHTDLVGLMLAGPKSREVLAALVDEDVSNAAFRFMDFREMDVAGAPCMVNRITYTGDLGYEIWMKPSFQRRVYLAIKEAGRATGSSISACGRCCRCGWRRTFRPGLPNCGPSTARSRGDGPLRQAAEARFHRPRGGGGRA
jgi:hypothetical protein